MAHLKCNKEGSIKKKEMRTPGGGPAPPDDLTTWEKLKNEVGLIVPTHPLNGYQGAINSALNIGYGKDRRKYECKPCYPSLTFDRKFLAKRHEIVEQHSGFALVCTGCQLTFPRRDSRASCHWKYAGSQRMEVMRWWDGMRDSKAKEELDNYLSHIDDFIRVVSPGVIWS